MERRITLLVMFIIPVTLTARTLALAAGGISLYYLVLGQDGNVAHMAHLAGGLAGYLYALRLKKTHGMLFGTAGWTHPSRAGGSWRAAWREKIFRHRFHVMDADDDTPPDKDEVNRILEKISAQGLASLSPRERDVLARASRYTSQRGSRF